MDYLVEIADHPDIEEAIAACPPAPMPTGTRDERIRCFYADSDYAARVWRQLRYCSEYRGRLIEDIVRLFEQSFTLALGVPDRVAELIGGRAVRVIKDLASASAELASLAKGFVHEPQEKKDDFVSRLSTQLRESPELVNALMQESSQRPFIPVLLSDIAEEELKARAGEQSARRSRDLLTEVEQLIKDRGRTRELAERYELAVPFSFVHERELDEIAEQRQRRPSPVHGPEERLNKSPFERALKMNLLGLAFSGGGIRSATFNLGVLQGLAGLGLLWHCDYLSTVSGGGYIGSWFGAWTKRLMESEEPAQAVTDINDRLSPTRTGNPLNERVRPIRWLREFSNYLTPEKGFFTADTWTMVAIYARNAALNLTILFLFLAGLMLLPGVVHGVLVALFHSERTWVPLVLIAVLLVIAAKGLGDSLQLLDPQNSRQQGDSEGEQAGTRRPQRKAFQGSGVGQLGVQIRIVIPFFTAAVLASAWLWVLLHPGDLRFVAWPATAPRWLLPSWSVGAGGFLVGLIVWEFWLISNRTLRRRTLHAVGLLVAAVIAAITVACAGGLEQFSSLSPAGQVSLAFGATTAALLFLAEARGAYFRCWPRKDRPVATLCLALCTIVAGAVSGALTWAVAKLFTSDSWQESRGGFWHALAFGPPLLLTVLAIAIVFQLGLLGARYPDERREWWGRMRAWGIIYSLSWLAAFLFAVYVPLAWASMTDMPWVRSGGGIGAALVWVASTYSGLRKSRTVQVKIQDDRKAPTQPRATRLIVTAAPYIFIVGFLALVSLVVWWTLNANFVYAPPGAEGYWLGINYDLPRPFYFFLAAALMIAVSSLLSSRVGVNEFSMHHFYKNRLVRCYLGASRWNVRKADLFTGFDPEDDMPLSNFVANNSGRKKSEYPGPYPILNAAVNLVKGDDLAWQERKANSFVFSPAYCGYDVDRAVLSKRGENSHDDAYRPTRHFSNEMCGVRLGTALAISGAAAGSGMGRITTPASAFLMTVFNVRLGWWLGNPRRRGEYWKKPGPTFGLAYALVELLGLTNDRRPFINVSDGGHFENLGVYELIRRGCRFIIASDAGQDGSFAFEDLGNLIRKCRTDFGVEIDIRLDCVRTLDAHKWTKTHCAVGEIRYPNGETGVLVYLKPTITGDEPFDILEYYHRVPEFPHETTADQWFNESQFESYRQLGLHIATCAFQRLCPDPDKVDPSHGFFQRLHQYWFPPSEVISGGNTSNLTNDFTAIMERVRSIPDLEFLDTTLFPSWPVLTADDGGGPVATRAKRSARYICNALLQLMENVYFDLDLETNHDHPHVEGWMSVFRFWAKQTVFEETWRSVKDTYAKRFQDFYDDIVAGKRTS